MQYIYIGKLDIPQAYMSHELHDPIHFYSIKGKRKNEWMYFVFTYSKAKHERHQLNCSKVQESHHPIMVEKYTRIEPPQGNLIVIIQHMTHKTKN